MKNNEIKELIFNTIDNLDEKTVNEEMSLVGVEVEDFKETARSVLNYEIEKGLTKDIVFEEAIKVLIYGSVINKITNQLQIEQEGEMDNE